MSIMKKVKKWTYGKPPGFPPFPMPPMSPPLALDRESFNELKHLIILVILTDKPDGLTGYSLQKRYKLSRTSVLRLLESLEELEYVDTKVDLVKGRSHKLFILTERGKEYLEELKKKWAYQLAFLSEIAPPEEYGHPLMSIGLQRRFLFEIPDFESKDDALDYFRGLRSHLKQLHTRFERRKIIINNVRTALDKIISQIEKMEDFNLENISKLLENVRENIMKLDREANEDKEYEVE